MDHNELKDRMTTELSAGKNIFKRGQTADVAVVILKGSVSVRSPYGGYQLKAGDVFGLFDVFSGEYLFDYSTKEDTQFLPFYIRNTDYVRSVLSEEKRYISFSIMSMAGQVKNLIHAQEILYQNSKGVYQRMKITYEKYKNYAQKYMVTVPALDELQALTAEYEENAVNAKMKQRSMELLNQTYESITMMFGNTPALADMLLEQFSIIAREADLACRNLLEFVKKEFLLLSNRDERNLFAGFFSMGLQILEAKGDTSSVVKEIDALMNEIVGLSELLEQELGIWIDTDEERLKDMRTRLCKQDASVSDDSILHHYSVNETQVALDSLKDTMKQILDYAQWEEGEKEEFRSSLTAYRLQKAKNFEGDDGRRVIHSFEKQYYVLYEAVFLHTQDSEGEEEIPAAVKLFLDYGMISEKDFDESQLVELYHIANAQRSSGVYHIHSMSDWLHLIFIGEKEPSKNEFDEDYRESLISLKKQQTMTAEEEKAYLCDNVRKVRYEIENMFRLNNRIVFASNSNFCPFVSGEGFSKDIRSQIMDVNNLTIELEKIRRIDYSCFYRESMYQDKENKNEHFRIMVEVLPDLILIPNTGARGSMWQEIEGRKRASSARFALPMYPTAPLSDLLLPILGKYRWEFCRTEQGTRWNDVTEKSLTSEYYDYMQYYKKNQDLSDTIKTKLKERMTQHRNNISEIFISDYASWIKFESQGASRLNKVSREIFSRYCPFSQTISKNLTTNPMFGDLIARNEAKKAKKAREISTHYQNMQKNGIEITEELRNHLDFFKM